MYAIRNDKFYLMTLVGNIVLPDIPKTKITKNLKSLLTGRMFATCHLIADLVNLHEKETIVYMSKVIGSAF